MLLNIYKKISGYLQRGLAPCLVGFRELRGRFSQGNRLRSVNFSKVIYHCVFNEVDISFKYSGIYLIKSFWKLCTTENRKIVSMGQRFWTVCSRALLFSANLCCVSLVLNEYLINTLLDSNLPGFDKRPDYVTQVRAADFQNVLLDSHVSKHISKNCSNRGGL